ncbi:hypothetical protein R1sor_013654 [Riccia sorocarpa]|uniref:Uncharacterized protein n=1 Tax=Riccia sorocarpa TaxID=122646 RepID=A0ABD3H778_9MARC
MSSGSSSHTNSPDEERLQLMDPRRYLLFQSWAREVEVSVEEATEDFLLRLTEVEGSGQTVCIVDHVEEYYEFKESYSFLTHTFCDGVLMTLRTTIFSADQMKRIPKNFENLEAYFESFRWPTGGRYEVPVSLRSEVGPQIYLRLTGDQTRSQLVNSIKQFCSARDLNVSQTEAVTTTAIALRYREEPKIRLIKGPLGTGKTAVVVSLLSSLLDNGERLEVESTLSMIYLPLRVKRLSAAVSHSRGWRQSLQNVEKILKNPHSLFEARDPGSSHDIKKFLESFREELLCWGSQLNLSGYILRRDLPRSLLEPAFSRYINMICTAMADVLESLPSDFGSYNEPQLWSWFLAASNQDPGGWCELSFCVKEQDHLRETVEKLLSLTSSPFKEKVSARLSNLNEDNLEEKCLRHARIVFCTIASAGRACTQNSGNFQSLVIDEAPQLAEGETAIVTQMAGLQQAVLVGDEKQLPATVVSMMARHIGYGRSLFERLQLVQHPYQLLKTQYRMHPEICSFPNREFYQGCLEDDKSVKGDMYEKPYQNQYGAYCFINVPDGKELRDENGDSCCNLAEVEVLYFLVKKLQTVCEDHGISRTSVGIITPYASQVDELSRKLCEGDEDSLKQFPNLQVEIKTIDGFQGSERDVILFSTVRANTEGEIGILTESRRLNVALTRARYCLWIIGHAVTLGGSRDGIWTRLLNDARSRNCFKDVREDEDMLKSYQHLERFVNLESSPSYEGESSTKRSRVM